MQQFPNLKFFLDQQDHGRIVHHHGGRQPPGGNCLGFTTWLAMFRSMPDLVHIQMEGPLIGRWVLRPTCLPRRGSKALSFRCPKLGDWL